MYFSLEDILKAEHEAIAEVIDFSDRNTPEDYGIERIRGIRIMFNSIMNTKREVDS